MRVLVLHSDVAPDAPPEDQDTLIAAKAVAEALRTRGHEARLAVFAPDEEKLRALVARLEPEVVFNQVESIAGQGRLAHIAPRMLGAIGVPYTGASAEALINACDKPRAKRRLRDAGLPTPDWSEPPAWEGVGADLHYIVKAADEDASIGLDDAAVVTGDAVRARAEASAARFGGRWFAERFIEGREFNVSILQEGNSPLILPLAEMTFEEWPQDRPRIVGYTAKWDEDSFDATRTVRVFGVEEREPELARVLSDLARRAWELFDLAGTARADFRVDAASRPWLLEINPNPCIAPDAGFAAAAMRAGLSFPELIERIVLAALGAR